MRDADVVNFCLDNGISCTYHDATLVIAQYDENSNGRLCFTEFNQFALPATNESLRELATSRDYSLYKSNSSILLSTLEAALARLFAAEIEYQRRVEAIKADLNSRFDFETRLAFEELDRAAPIGRIERYEIRNFIDAHLRWLSEAELDAIIRRCDTDGDECLSYLEFSEVVHGIHKEVIVSHHISPLESSPRRHSPLRSTHSPYRAPRIEELNSKPFHSHVRQQSPYRISTVHHSPIRANTYHSPHRHTHIESPRASSPIRHTHIASPRASSPIRRSVTRSSPFRNTVTSLSRTDELRGKTNLFVYGI